MNPTFSLKLCGEPQRQLAVGVKDKSFRAGQIQLQISISPSTSLSESQFLSSSLFFCFELNLTTRTKTVEQCLTRRNCWMDGSWRQCFWKDHPEEKLFSHWFPSEIVRKRVCVVTVWPLLLFWAPAPSILELLLYRPHPSNTLPHLPNLYLC